MEDIKEVHEIIEEVVPYYKKKRGPEAEHKLVYQSEVETLEPLYFWILDLMRDFGLAPEKLVDNFTSSPGSGHFQELSLRAASMQQQGDTMLKTIFTILRSVMQIIYDLKEFKIRLQAYDDAKSKEKDKKEAAMLSLKQIWMDKVDIQKGNSSIKAMALGQAGFQTLIDAFLVAKDPKDVDKLDLNDRIKRILKPRVQEFNYWMKESEKELRKRYGLERTYLKSQVNSLKLYSKWIKPYLKAAAVLQQKDQGRNPDLVKTFNMTLLELTILGKQKLDVKSAALVGDLPKDFQKLKTKRDYYACVLVDFRFRGMPQKIGQSFAIGGRAEATFRAYALNEDELAKINEELDKSDIADALRLIEGTTSESLKQLQEEINMFLEEQDKDDKSEEKETKDGSNPFLALIGYYNKKEDKKNKDSKDKKPKKKTGKIRPDNWIEKEHLRPLAAESAAETAYRTMDVYKKAHGMASFT